MGTVWHGEVTNVVRCLKMPGVASRPKSAMSLIACLMQLG